MSIFSFLFGGCGKKPARAFSISNKEMLAQGWNETELKKIVDDFKQANHDHLPPNFSAAVHSEGKSISKITFPADIDPRLFCWLINYVQYPKGFDLSSRKILILGNATITSDFLPSDQILIGKRIMIYIPANDKEYDLVFAQVDGRSYEFPFSSETWRSVEDPRLPVEINELPSQNGHK